MHEKGGPAHHKHSKEDGEGQGASHAVAPPPPTPAPPTPVGRQGCDFLGVYASQQEHVDVYQVDAHQGDNEEDHEAGLDEVGIKELHHEHGRDAARCPDGGQDGARAPHCHDVVVSKGVKDGDVTEMYKKGRIKINSCWSADAADKQQQCIFTSDCTFKNENTYKYICTIYQCFSTQKGYVIFLLFNGGL